MSRSKSRARQQELRYYLGGGLLFLSVLVVAVFATIARVRAGNGAPDAVTMCPADGPKGHYVLLVDKTDPLTFTQKEAFTVILRDLVERRTPKGYLLSIFVLGEDYKQNAKPLIELCNPGAGAEKSQWTGDVKGTQKQYEEKFIAPMLKESEALLVSKSAKSSPIFEMLQMVGINGYQKRAISGPRRLFIVSDMLQHTPEFDMYAGDYDFATFEESAYGKKSQAELKDVEVEINYLMNTPRLQSRRNSTFWERYFEKSGARVVSINPVEG
jgi:hypothetical protein